MQIVFLICLKNIIYHLSAKMVIVKETNILRFQVKNMIITVALEWYGLISVSVTSLETNQSASMEEVLTYSTKGIIRSSYFLSERFPVERALDEFSNLIMNKLLPMIRDGSINDAWNAIEMHRGNSSQRSRNNQLGKEAKEAFDEKRYRDVIMLCSQMSEFSRTQKKRFEVAQKRVGAMSDEE